MDVFDIINDPKKYGYRPIRLNLNCNTVDIYVFEKSIEIENYHYNNTYFYEGIRILIKFKKPHGLNKFDLEKIR